MPLFYWKGLAASGAIVHGRIIAINGQRLREILRERRIGLLFCTPSRLLLGKRVNAMLRAELYKQLGALLQSGVTFSQALDLLLHTTPHMSMGLQLERVYNQLRTGQTARHAFACAGTLFSARAQSMLCASMHADTVADVCLLLSRYETAQKEFKDMLARLLFGPVSTVLIGAIITVVLFVFIMPTYQELFASMHTELPPLTRRLLSVTQWLLLPWNQLLIVAFLVLLCLITYWLHTSKKRFIQNVYRHMPFCGVIYQVRQLSDFLFCLGQLLRSGVAMTQAVRVASSGVQDRVLAAQCAQLGQALEQGATLPIAMQALVSSLPTGAHIRAIIHTAVQSGAIADGILHAAQHCQRHIEARLHAIARFAGPLMLLLVGACIFIACLGLYQPLLELPQAMHAL